jgi:hypothetical protein
MKTCRATRQTSLSVARFYLQKKITKIAKQYCNVCARISSLVIPKRFRGVCLRWASEFLRFKDEILNFRAVDFSFSLFSHQTHQIRLRIPLNFLSLSHPNKTEKKHSAQSHLVSAVVRYYYCCVPRVLASDKKNKNWKMKGVHACSTLPLHSIAISSREMSRFSLKKFDICE